MGLHFDEMREGTEWRTPTRTITEADVVMFAAMSGDYNEIHTSITAAQATPFGQRVVHGLLGLAISHGLMFRLGLLDGTGVAFLGVEEWRFLAPIFIGDTIHCVVTVRESRPSRSRPGTGVVRFLVRVIKQDGTVCQEGIQTVLVKGRPSGEGGGA